MQVLIWKALIWILSHLWTIIWMMVFIPSATRSLMGKVTAILMKMKSTLLSIPQPAHAQRSNPFWPHLTLQARISRVTEFVLRYALLAPFAMGLWFPAGWFPWQLNFHAIQAKTLHWDKESTLCSFTGRYLPTSTACSQLSAEYKIFYGWYKARGVHLEFKKMQSGINWLLNQFHDTCRGEQNLTNVHGKFRVAGSDENNNPSAILFMWKNE